MIKTENGNNQMTLEEFREELKKFNPIIEEKTSEVAYKEINDMLICGIQEVTPKWDCYNSTIRYIKEEKRDEWKILYVSLGYDAPPYSLVPQDMPYKLLLLCKTDGEVYTIDWVRSFIKQQGEKHENS